MYHEVKEGMDIKKKAISSDSLFNLISIYFNLVLVPIHCQVAQRFFNSE